MGRGNVDESAGDTEKSIIHCCFIDGFVILWGDEILSIG